MERRDFIKGLGASVLLLGVAPMVFAKSKCDKCNELICKEAWEKLRLLKGLAFQYIHPQKELPNVLIYGDSISIGYTPTVRESLKGKANVFRIYRNGGASHELIPAIELMHKSMFQPHLKNGWNFEWDLIHFNLGLHDLKYLHNGQLDKVNGKQVSSIKEYKTKLDKVCKYLRSEFPKAKLVFATTTPVPEGAEGRIAGDSVKYNKAALEILEKYPSIVINDLYAFTKPNFDMWNRKPGNVHYKEIGKKAQGKEVAQIIGENL